MAWDRMAGEEKQQLQMEGLTFGLVGLAPLFVPYALLTFGALLAGFIALGTPASQGGALTMLALAALLVGLPVAALLALAWLVRRKSNWLRRGIYLYLTLDTLVVGLLLVVLFGIGGSSMAAAEGLAATRQLAGASVPDAVFGLLVAQGCIVPWAAIITYLTHRRFRPG